jgi:hypothetical protein
MPHAIFNVAAAERKSYVTISFIVSRGIALLSLSDGRKMLFSPPPPPPCCRCLPGQLP